MLNTIKYDILYESVFSKLKITPILTEYMMHIKQIIKNKRFKTKRLHHGMVIIKFSYYRILPRSANRRAVFCAYYLSVSPQIIYEVQNKREEVLTQKGIKNVF